MKRLVVILFFALAPWAAGGEVPPFDQEKLDAFWDHHPTPELWETAYQDLSSQLEDSYREDGIKSFTENPNFIPWFYTCSWLRLGLAAKSVRDNADLTKAFVALGRQPSVSHLLVKSLRPGDNMERAVEILVRLQFSIPEKTKEYGDLAVAYSIVFDQEFPEDWPHFQVKQDAVPKGNRDPVDRFRFYVEANENHALDYDLRKLTVRELKFMVDSLVSLNELRYAQKSKFTRSKLESAFSSITYDNPRFKNAFYTWTYPTYKLKDIEDNGGICVDQAYYASEMGKGRGVPTLYFSGQGSDGGHAWFGFLEKENKWSLDCGRYASQNYPVGYAKDPQSWRPINDAELEFLFRDLSRNPNEASSQAALLWALQHGSGKNIPSSLHTYFDDARSLAPENPEIWKYEQLALTKEKTDPTQLKSFYEAWIKQFNKNTDMKVEGQAFLLEVLTQTQDPLAADLKKEIVRENRKKRFDLGIGAGANNIFEQLDSKNWAEAEKEFKKMVRQFDAQGGGNLFYQIIKPYVTTCLEEGQDEMASDALKYADRKLNREKGSILDKEFEELDQAVNHKK